MSATSKSHRLSEIAARAYWLGFSTAVGILAALWLISVTSSPFWRLAFFLATLSLFHFLEFWITATYNPGRASVASFLLRSNGRAYIVAQISAICEAVCVGLAFPEPLLIPATVGRLLLAAGIALTLLGQTARSIAMAQCGTNFNHVVQHRREPGHHLITSGIYSIMRHPSYFGYFCWALGVQLVMGNFVCLFTFSVVLWRFFHARIRHEEKLLVDFFGVEYIRYRSLVGTMIPFIP